jgi:POT family proton-dependent oligopeptide transporter
MSTTANLDSDAITRAGLGGDPEHHGIPDIEDEKHHGHMDVEKISHDDEDYPDKPTEEQMRTLRRVSGKIKWSMWTIAFVELCERFSYYGSTVLYTNFITQPLPLGSNTGAVTALSAANAVPGALGKGTQTSQALSLFNQFFAYVMPLLG